MTGRYLEIAEILSMARQGRTDPFICKAVDGEKYIVKGSSAAIIGLIKEWMGANLGREFGLPIPEFRITQVDMSLLRAYGEDAVDSIGPLPAFASKSVEPTHDLSYSSVSDIDLKLRQDIFIFDMWVHNGDRTLSELGGNPNLLWDGQQLYVIDHNLIFDPSSSDSSNISSHVFGDQVNNILGDYLLRQQLQTRMQSALVGWSNWWDTLPEEWVEINDDLELLDQQRIYQQLEQDAQGAIWMRLST